MLTVFGRPPGHAQGLASTASQEIATLSDWRIICNEERESDVIFKAFNLLWWRYFSEQQLAALKMYLGR